MEEKGRRDTEKGGHHRENKHISKNPIADLSLPGPNGRRLGTKGMKWGLSWLTNVTRCDVIIAVLMEI